MDLTEFNITWKVVFLCDVDIEHILAPKGSEKFKRHKMHYTLSNKGQLKFAYLVLTLIFTGILTSFNP